MACVRVRASQLALLLRTQVPYDMLVVAVGSVNNTFGIKGVKEHTLAFRGIRDATALRRQVSECFERAALPHTPPEVLQCVCFIC